MTDPAQRLGRFRILHLLGRGGMGEVHLATATGAAGFEKPVVLKILRPRYDHDPERTARLLREAMIGVRLDHEHVVQVLDLGEEDGKYFIAFEYVRGFTLAHLIKHMAAAGERLPIGPMVHVARAIADALGHVHGLADTDGTPLSLIHRDVSPSNVLLGVDGRIKLSDFGIAALGQDDAETSGLIGKPPYLPGEAFTGATARQAWDVYALGVVLYEALTGGRAFPGDNVPDVIASIGRGATPLASARPDCPAALAAVVERAIARTPEDRFARAVDLRAALDDAVPRAVDDADLHRALIEGIYAHADFVAVHGQLPAVGIGTETLATVNERLSSDRRAATADLATEDKPIVPPLRFGLSPALGPALARAHGERLAARLEKGLGRAARSVVVADYRSLVDCLVEKEVDLAWMPPAAFIDASERGASALVVARRRGRTTYESAIIVRADSPFQKLQDLRGQSMAWVDRESAAGYLFPVADVLRELGQPTVVFKRQHFHGSHQAVCEAVANGWAAAGAVYAVRDDKGVVTHGAWGDTLGERAVEVRPISFSAPIPGDNLAVRPQMNAELVERLGDLLVGLSDDEEGRLLLRDVFNAESFLRADLSADLYAQVRATIRLARQVV